MRLEGFGSIKSLRTTGVEGLEFDLRTSKIGMGISKQFTILELFQIVSYNRIENTESYSVVLSKINTVSSGTCHRRYFRLEE